MSSHRVTVAGMVVRSVWQRKLRLLLTVISTGAAVALFTATSTVSSSLNRSFEALFTQLSGGVDLQVRESSAFGNPTTRARGSVDAALAGQIRQLPGVAKSEPLLVRPVTLLGVDGQPILPLAGPSLLLAVPAEPFNGIELRDGQLPVRAGEVVLDVRTATRIDAQIGESVVEVTTAGQRSAVRVVGTIAQTGGGEYLGAIIIGAAPDVASELAGVPGRAQNIAISLLPGVDREAATSAIADILPDQVEIVDTQVVLDEQLAALDRFLKPFGRTLVAFSLIALFVAGFITTNTFTISVSQRLRELALLRAVGATASQVMRFVLIEAALLSVVATAAGIAVGVQLADLIVTLFASAGGFPVTGLALNGATLLGAAGAGILTTLVACVRPAVRAGRTSPATALSGNEAPEKRRRNSGALLCGVGSVLLLLSTSADSVRTVLVLAASGALALFIGIPTVAASCVAPLSWLTTRLRPGSVVVALASANAQRSPQRTAASASALIVGLSVVAAVSVVGASLAATVTDSVESKLDATHIAVPAVKGPAPIPESFLQRATDTKGSGAVVGVRRGTVQIDGQTRVVSVLEGDGISKIFELGDADGNLELLGKAGFLAVQADVAAEAGVTIGSDVAVLYQNGEASALRVAAVYQSSGVLLQDWIISKSSLTDNGVTPSTLRYVAIQAGSLSTNDAELRREYPEVEIQTVEEFAREQRERVGRLLFVVYALLGITIGVAIIGIANTLSLSVLERSRELALLRAIGASYQQVRRTVKVEAVVVAVLGAAIGVCVGTALGVLVVNALPADLAGVLAIPWYKLTLLGFGTAAAGLAAS